jgi:two-component system chemotaxis response regulator CheY
MAKFMLVDDEPVMRGVYRDLLQFKGHEILGEAADGQECLDMFRVLPDVPDFIIMDQRMPKITGIEATRELLAVNPELRVVLVTADDMCQREAEEAGVYDYVEKPFKMQKFLDIFENRTGRVMERERA